jgi:hypothetical protein
MLAEADWHLGTEATALLNFGWTDAGRQLAALMRESVTRDDYLAMIDGDWAVDLAPLLPQIVTPTLVCSLLQLHPAR